MTGYLYAGYYAFDPTLADPATFDPLIRMGLRFADPAFLAILRSSNPAQTYIDEGWEIRAALGKGSYQVRKHGISLVVQEGIHFPFGRAHSGAALGVRFPAESLAASPGFYVVFGEAGPAAGSGLIRLYLNLERTTVASAVRRLLDRLHAKGIVYTAKILAERKGRRRDNFVLYCTREDLPFIGAMIAEFHTMAPRAFRRTVPAFTLPLLPGVAVAEDPEGRQPFQHSFGEHRCGLIAEAVLATAAKDGPFDRSTLLRDIVARFADHNIDAQWPCSHSQAARALFFSLQESLGGHRHCDGVAGSRATDG